MNTSPSNGLLFCLLLSSVQGEQGMMNAPSNGFVYCCVRVNWSVVDNKGLLALSTQLSWRHCIWADDRSY